METTELTISSFAGAREVAVIPAQASSDEQIIDMWLHGRSLQTQRAYAREVRGFLGYVGVGLRSVSLGMLQGWADNPDLASLAPASRARAIAAVKSVFAFGHRLGYLPFDVAAPLRSPKLKDTLSERILTEADVQRMLALETNKRNAVLLRLLYAAGLRVSEACGLSWRDCSERSDGQGQVTAYGKGEKTRAILLPATMWAALMSIKPVGASPDAPVFPSRKGGAAMSDVQIRRIVLAAAQRAGIELHVSPHWMRHAHASHSIDRGAPISLVQATLGHSSVATTGRYLHARPSDSSARFLAV